MNPLTQDESAGDEVESAAPSRGISLFRYSPALILIAIAMADAGRLADPDLWGHIRFGQATLTQGHPPWRDIYSYSVPGHPVVDHEWLTEVCMAWFYNSLGVLGLKLFKFLCSAGTIIFLALAIGETEAPTLVQFGVLIGSAVAIMPQMEFRPQLFTFALLAALLALLVRETRGRRAPLWLAVPMLALWANLHGGFIMGLAALGTFSAVVCAQDFIAGRGLRGAWRLFGITAAATLATVITPYGLGIWRSVLRGIEDPYSYTVVVEWQSLSHAIMFEWLTRPGGIVYIVVALLMFATLAVSFTLTPSSDDLPLVAFAAITIVSAFVSVRNLPIAVVATAVPLTRHLGVAVTGWRIRKGLPADPVKARSSPANQLIVTLIAVVLAVETGLFSDQLRAGSHYPVGAISFMERHDLHGKVLDNYLWGEYLIWHIEPKSRIFIDGRNDFAYPISLIGKYLRFHFDLPGGAQVLKEYPPNFVLISPDAPSVKLMESQPGWELIYQDPVSALFATKGSPATRIPGVPVRLAKAPPSYFP